jgi:hypothetical protein
MKFGFYRPAPSLREPRAEIRAVANGLDDKSCGACSQCCTTHPVEDFEKPAHHACVHVRAGQGCSQWGLHPQSCQSFKCLWIRHPRLDGQWRPDRAGFILRTDADGVTLHVDVSADRPGAWLEEPFYTQLKAWSAGILSGEGRILIHDGDYELLMTPDEVLSLRPLKPGEVLETGVEPSLFGPRVYVRILSRAQLAQAAPNPPRLKNCA